MNLMKKAAMALMAAGMLVAVLLETASAKTDHSAHMGMAVPATNGAASEAHKATMDRMHAAMIAGEYSSDADIDFTRSMIPHHQAAIDMANVLFEHGKNPEVRKLAEECIAAQEIKIKHMNVRLAANPPWLHYLK